MPGGTINSVAEALREPQALAHELAISPEGIPGLRTPLVFSRSRLALDRAAPTLGDGVWQFGTPIDQFES